MQRKFFQRSLKRIPDNWKLLSDDSDNIFNCSNTSLGELKSLCNESISSEKERSRPCQKGPCLVLTAGL